jgi:hypothetical protein
MISAVLTATGTVVLGRSSIPALHPYGPFARTVAGESGLSHDRISQEVVRVDDLGRTAPDLAVGVPSDLQLADGGRHGAPDVPARDCGRRRS